MKDGTFLTVLSRAAETADRGFIFLDGELREASYPFRALVDEAKRRGRHLQRLGLQKGDRLAMIVPESEDFVLTFLGAVSVGVVPVPMYPPLALGRLDSYMDATARILRASRARMLLTTKKVAPVLWSLTSTVSGLEDIVTMDALEGPIEEGRPVEISPSDPCFLQFTSGSTSDPKGVIVTHASLVANAHAIMFDGLKSVAERDRGVSWLPLYHDMGLIGFVLAPIYATVPVVFLPTLSFVKRPTVWMETVSKYRGTITFAPNFAFALAAKYSARHKVGELDLSSLRVLGCGAEPINAGTVRKFQDAFSGFGLDPNAIMPCYGMAEATLAMSFDRIDRPFSSAVIDRASYENDAKAHPPVDALATEIVSCGRTFPGHDLAIMDPSGALLTERSVGEIVFRGPSVSAGYFENPSATSEVFKDGWLHTGDLGFMIDGEVFVSGRMKDLIILNGRNYHPQAIEWEAEKVEGIRKSNVVAFALKGEETEKLVLVAEVKKDQPMTTALQDEVKAGVKNGLGLTVHEVVLVPAGALPKTSSGKLQRKKTCAAYMDGSLGREDRTQGGGKSTAIAKHVAKSAVAKIRHRVKQTIHRRREERDAN
jgi:fatty-acyl-CoA synthase